MKHLPDTTLAYFEAMPQIREHDLGGISCALFAQNLLEYRQQLPQPHEVLPDHEALQFYLFNHLASLVRAKFTRHEPLPQWAGAVMHEYKRVLQQQGNRLTGYMMLIITRESRHLHTLPDTWWAVVQKQWTEQPRKFHATIHGCGSLEAANRFLNNPPTMTLKNHVESLAYMFHKGKFSSNFGGKPWGVIADTLAQFLTGKITQEMLIDTAYTLAHNNGPMFNKGMLYAAYTSHFVKLLDVQRSGQIPEWVIEIGPTGLATGQNAIFSEAVVHLPDEFGKYVDWYKVEALGALSNVKVQQQAQDKKYGKKPVFAMFNGQKSKQVGVFAVAPGVQVNTFERVGA